MKPIKIKKIANYKINDLAKNTVNGKNKSLNRMGVLFNCTPKEFVEAIAQHRSWDRENSRRSSHPKAESKL